MHWQPGVYSRYFHKDASDTFLLNGHLIYRMQSISPIGSDQEDNLGNEEDSNLENPEYQAPTQLQLQDPILTILMMPLIHFNQIITQINKMITTGPMSFAPMQSTAPIPFAPMQSDQGGLKITELRRDSSGNIVSIVEKW